MNFYVQCIITGALFTVPLRLVTTNRLSPILFYIYFSLLLLFAVVLPLTFYFSLALQRGVLYFYFLDRPHEGVLDNPEKVGLQNTRNFYIQNGDISLGIWHLLPSCYPSFANRSDSAFEKSLGDGRPIFLYIHGNLGSRATEHRLHLYRTLQSLNYQVITFDYRCFGDSSYSTPYEAAVESDCLVVAKWVLQHAGSSPLFLWGHSLGAGMTTNVAATLAKEGYETKGVILEAPFDNMPSEIRVHPFGKIFRLFPWYDYFFSSPYYTNGEDFYSSKYIQQFVAPIMILHAEDDGIIPSELGEKLYCLGRHTRPPGSGPMSLKVFDASRGFGHSDLCKAEELPALIGGFVDKYKNETFPYRSGQEH